MKNLLIILLGATLIFFGCSKDNFVNPGPDQNDQSTLKKAHVRTTFTGTSNWVVDSNKGTVTIRPNGNMLIEGIVSEWYDETDAWQTTGQSIWYEDWEFFEKAKKIKIGGKAELNVAPGDASHYGKWEMSWHGWINDYAFDEDGNFSKGIVSVVVVGKGVSGEVEGLVGHWKYHMDLSEGFTYYCDGFFN